MCYSGGLWLLRCVVFIILDVLARVFDRFVALVLLFDFVVYLIYAGGFGCCLLIWLVACCYLGLSFGCVCFSWFMALILL